MRKVILFIIILMMAGGLLVGCKGSNESKTLTINISSNGYVEFVKALKAEFPKINFEVYSYQGDNSSEFLRSTIVNNDASDIIFTSFVMSDKDQQKYFLDMSGYGFVNNYDSTILNEFDIDGKLYSLPSTVRVRSMAYNKTLFEEKGWKKPESHTELVALCKQIRKEAPDITPIAMSNINGAYAFTTVTTLAQGNYLSTPAGNVWEEKYMAGEASVEDGFIQGISMVEDLVDAGAFDAEKYLGKWDDEVILGDFAEGKAAMMFIWGNQYSMVELCNVSDNEYELMPFYGYRDGTETLGIVSSAIWGINKELGKPENKKKLENAVEVMEWISSPEGQEYFIESETEIPTTGNLKEGKVAACYSKLWEDYQDSYKAFMLYDGYQDIMIDGGNVVQEAMLTDDATGMVEEFIKVCDKLHKASLASKEESYGELPNDLTAEETVQLVADALYEQNLGDIALVSIAGIDENYYKNDYGVAGWLYKGKITDMDISILCNNEGTNYIDTAQMKGSQLISYMRNGKTMKDEYTGEDCTWQYFSSGIDENDIDEEKIYTVVFLNGDYPEELTTDNKVKDTGILMTDACKEYIKKNY